MRALPQTQDQLQRHASPSPVLVNTVSSAPSHHAQPIQELQRTLGNRAVQQLLQRKTPIPAERPAPELDAATQLNLESNSPARIENPATWRVFARLMAKPDQAMVLAPLLHKYFTYFIETVPQITFESITEDERKLFLNETVLAPQARERLRLVALRNTALFKAVTDVTVNLAAVDKTARQTKMAQARLTGDKGNTLDAEPGSAAEQFTRWDENKQGVVAEVLGQASGKEKNAPLANLIVSVRKKDPGKLESVLEDKTWMYACGLGNLYALSVARGQADPSLDGARQWVHHWVLDQPPADAMLRREGNGIIFQTSPVLKSLAGSKTVSGGPGTGSTAHTAKDFETTLNRHRAGLKRGQEARIGIAQGYGKGHGAHMYIVYLDLDAVWRTMDVYLFLEDRPEGARAPLAGDYTVKLWEKLLVDEPKDRAEEKRP